MQLAVCRVEVCAAQPLPTVWKLLVIDASDGQLVYIQSKRDPVNRSDTSVQKKTKILRLRLVRTPDNHNNARAVTYSSILYADICCMNHIGAAEPPNPSGSMGVTHQGKALGATCVLGILKTLGAAAHRHRFFRVAAVLLTRRQEIIISMAPLVMFVGL